MRQEIELTSIEIQLLLSLISGASNKQIARELGKSEFTVRNQLSAIFQKIEVRNRMQAAFWFRSNLNSKYEHIELVNRCGANEYIHTIVDT